MYRIIINPELGGNQTGKSYNNKYEKDFNLKISKALNSKLNSLGINSTLVRNNDKDMSDEERKRFIDNNKSNNTIIITNGLGSNDIEIIYGLNKTDSLARTLATGLEDSNYVVDKYYQKRDSKNTNMDYDSIIRDFPNNNSIIIRYGDINNINYLENNIDSLVNIISSILQSYLGLSNNYYIVKKGDNLYSIARTYNTSVDDIKRLNNLSSNLLSIGQKLLIKGIQSTDNNMTYTVKNGDTLYSISRIFKTTVDSIKNVNNLKNNILSIGQKLIIPSTKSTNYTVKKGDTLYSIAKKNNVDIKDIMNLNNLRTTMLSIGQTLIIPYN